MPDETKLSLDAAFKAAQTTVEEGKTAAAAEASRRRAGDRSYIAKIIVWTFVLLMVWIVIAACVGAYLFDWDGLAEPAKFLMTILSSVMLPVVTLVIGYYFGSEK
ncbi:MAG: hypothetical protein IH605_01750 [Burkholderiales bacterium]|nr:hypothetical protein [Burkholderiales bacterium]